jgi:hypothetical protein
VPEIGFELQDEQGRVCAEAELAWPDKQVAVVLPERTAAPDIFRGRGWSVFDLTASSDDIPCQESGWLFQQAAQWGEEKRRQGWKREDFIRHLGRLLGINEGNQDD